MARPVQLSMAVDTTTDLERITASWGSSPQANIGFCPGRARIIVTDIDGPAGELAAQRLGLLAEPTFVVETGRGSHLYFSHPGGSIGNRKLAPSLDVRADAGYVLLPPSVHPNGKRYRSLGQPEDINTLPSTVLEALQGKRTKERHRHGSSPIDAGTPQRRSYVATAIEGECLQLAQAPEGDRNNVLNRAAFALARFVATGEADPGKLADVLAVAADHAGLDEHEVERTIQSAFGPRGVPV